MKRDSLVFAISGTLFGFLMGWFLNRVYEGRPAPAPTAVEAQAAPASNGPQTPQAQPLDTARVTQLEQQASASPKDATVRESLGNLYFDAGQYAPAAQWYEASLALGPKNADVSTDLAVCYYYLNDVDKALQQFERSLAIDPKHLKTLLNQGVVLAFGKNDLAKATAVWEQLVAISPDSPEGKRAKQGLEAIKTAHPGGTAPAGAATGGGKG